MHRVADPEFVVGAELVEFDHPERPIYDLQSGELAGTDGPSWGAPLDRLFGDGDGSHVETGLGASALDVTVGIADPLVELGNLADSLGLGEMDVAGAIALDVTPDTHGGLALHDVAAWDASGLDWTLDGHA